ncbi:hypothetical protein [Prosthecobacter sp.]|uniref:hypothetical protein n=1 Tax=Prosthecobacter sp. TaxID=1965333 RepID=UPI003784CDE8
MTLPYTKAESDTAHREWKAMCGHHSIAAASGRPLEAVRRSGIKLCGWMNPTMVSQCLSGLGVSAILHKLPTVKMNSDELLLEPYYHPRRVMRVQFHGPWMKGPPTVQYRYTHYIACLEEAIMDPLLDTNVLLRMEDWILWACSAYRAEIDECEGFSFTHAWNVQSLQ